MIRRNVNYSGAVAAPLDAVAEALSAMAARAHVTVERRGNEATVAGTYGPLRWNGTVALTRLGSRETGVALNGVVSGPTLFLAGVSIRNVAERFTRRVEERAQELAGPESGASL